MASLLLHNINAVYSIANDPRYVLCIPPTAFVIKHNMKFIRAGEFSIKLFTRPKSGFLVKKCPLKNWEPYAHFFPSEIWVIQLTQILINFIAVTIAQISRRGKIERRAPVFGGHFFYQKPGAR